MGKDYNDHARRCARLVGPWERTVERKALAMFVGYDLIRNGEVPQLDDPCVFFVAALSVASERYRDLVQLQRSVRYELDPSGPEHERRTVVVAKVATARLRSRELLNIVLPGAEPAKTFMSRFYDRRNTRADVDPEQELAQIVIAAQSLLEALDTLLKDVPDIPFSA